MNLKVQNQIPNNREGAKGEVRLITRGRTAFLYIKGINQWYILGLTPSANANTTQRLARGTEQRNIQKVADATWDGNDGEFVAITQPSSSGNKNRGAALPDIPL